MSELDSTPEQRTGHELVHSPDPGQPTARAQKGYKVQLEPCSNCGNSGSPGNGQATTDRPQDSTKPGWRRFDACGLLVALGVRHELVMSFSLMDSGLHAHEYSRCAGPACFVGRSGCC